MTIDWNVFVTAVAIGAVAEILTLNHPDKYRRVVATGKVLAVACGIALVPGAAGHWALLGLLVARGGDVFGEFVHEAVVRMALWWDERQWRTHQNQQDELPETSTTTSAPTSTGPWTS